MTRLLLIALAFMLALQSTPAAAFDDGERIGPVVMDPGGIICDTADDAITAIRKFNGESLDIPTSCGRIIQTPTAFIEVLWHYENAGNTYAIVKMVFPAFSSTQYGWVQETKDMQESPTINESALQRQGV